MSKLPIELKQSVDQIQTYLSTKSSKSSKHPLKLYDKSWFLIVGPSGGGKSSLIENAGLKIDYQFDLPNHLGHAWVTKQQVFISLSSTLLADDQAENWNQLANTLQSYRSQFPIDGVLYVQSIARLNDETALTAFIKQSSTLQAGHRSPIPVYFVFTHLDSICGFDPYMFDLSQEEKHAPFGFAFPENIEQSQITYAFTERYEQILQRLHDRLPEKYLSLVKLQQRCEASIFPIQLESLKESISAQLEHLTGPDSQHLIPAGLFLSANKTGAFHYILSEFNQYVDADTQGHNTTSNSAHFTKNLVNRTLTHCQPYSRKAMSTILSYVERKSKRIITSILSITALLLGYLFLQFNQMNTVYDQAGQTLTQFELSHQDSHDTPLTSSLKTINGLNHTRLTLSALPSFWLFHQNKLTAFKQKTTNIYREAIRNHLLPQVRAKIEKNLSERRNKSISQTYAALKAYLMLGDPSHMDKAYFKKYMLELFTNDPNLTNEDITALNTHLSVFIKENISLPLDGNLIKTTRRGLQTLSNDVVVELLINHHLIYHSRHSSEAASVLRNPSLLIAKKDIKTPYLFTKDGYMEMFNDIIPTIAHQNQYGNWIIGSSPNQANLTVSLLKEKLLTFYAKGYLAWWKQIYVNEKPMSINQLSEAIQTYQHLSTHIKDLVGTNPKTEQTSPLVSHDHWAQDFNNRIASHFYTNAPITKEKEKELSLIFKYLSEYLMQMQETSMGDAFAFEFMKQRFLEPKTDPLEMLIQNTLYAPSPYKEQLEKLIVGTWKIILPRVHQYISKKYQQEIFSFYQKNIADKYPIHKESDQDLPLSSFDEFFKPQGKLSKFFKEYLAPFVDTSTDTWPEKSISGFKLNINRDIIEQFMRCHLITSMFYPQGELTVDFKLQPLKLQPIVSTVNIRLDGQSLKNTHKTKRAKKFHWPAKHPDNSNVALSLKDRTGKTASVVRSGPWAIFRLLDNANLKAKQNTKEYELLFTIRGNSATYLLTADQTINPFIPNILPALYLPTKAFG